MTEPPSPLALALERAKTTVAPDERVTCFDVSLRIDDGGGHTPDGTGGGDTPDDTGSGDAAVVLEGIVEDESARRAVGRELERTAGTGRVRNELRTLDRYYEPLTTVHHATPVRVDPDEESEQVTQALYGAQLAGYDRRDGWRRVRTSDGYLGWTADRHLVIPPVDDDETTDSDAWDADAVITNAPTTAERTGEEAGRRLPSRLQAGTRCRLESTGDDAGATVSFRTGLEARVPADAVRSLAPLVSNGDETSVRATGDDVVDVARQYLGTTYEWGGKRADGIDCSGLVWVSYACVGVTLPRDADQQERIGTDVDRDDLEPGDLLFFPGHVAISLGGSSYVHASGDADEVRINSLDPDDEDYREGLDDSLRTTKRLLYSSH